MIKITVLIPEYCDLDIYHDDVSGEYFVGGDDGYDRIVLPTTAVPEEKAQKIRVTARHLPGESHNEWCLREYGLTEEVFGELKPEERTAARAKKLGSSS